MINTKLIALVQNKVFVGIVLFSIFLGIVVFAPLLNNQFITGPIVNAVLFLSTVYLGAGAGILISFLPSLFALSVGLLPVPLLPMIPYIILANAALVLSFDYLRDKSFGLAVVSASFLKFLLLFASSSYIINFFIKGSLPAKIAVMMSWPQLITALIGGLIAFFVIKAVKKYEV